MSQDAVPFDEVIAKIETDLASHLPNSGRPLGHIVLTREMAQVLVDTAALKLGATGQYPHGKLDDSDEGELRAAIYPYKGRVRIDFGKPVAWLTIIPTGARELAAVLLQNAAKAETAESGKS